MTGTSQAAATIAWLLEGDPSVRWQVMRDLLDSPPDEFERERERIPETGFGRRLLAEQADDGRWAVDRGPEGFEGLYSPKWTSTTYTLLLLRRLGLQPRHPAALRGCDALVERAHWFEDGSVAPWKTPRTDTCVCGMILGILEGLDHGAVDRRDGLTRFLLQNQKADGGWNCQPSEVGSMHTTLSVLEGLQLRDPDGADEAIATAMARGHEYLIARRLFRSLRTGDVIQSSWRRFSFPPRWKYDVLRALDHLQDANATRDDRLAEAIELLQSKRRADGTWRLQNRHSGESYFEMEDVGAPSRWNTLRALRSLRWWGIQDQDVA